jgi:hypothetical protein
VNRGFAQDLDIIIKHGITKTDINKFKEAGYMTIDSVAMTVKKQLVNIKVNLLCQVHADGPAHLL